MSFRIYVHEYENLVAMHITNHEQQPNPEEILSRYNLPNVADVVEKAIEEYSEG